MIPLRDNIRSHTFPFITILLIIVNFYIFYQELLLSNHVLNRVIARYGLVPAKFLQAFHAASSSPSTYLPLFSNLFLHGGWLHIIGNMWYLWIFADNIEDCLGHLGFLAFYLASGLVANLAQVLVDPTSTVPTIGASGAVSGVLGAYFVCYPWARISTLIPLIFLFPIVEIPAIAFLGFWFLLQLEHGTSPFFAGASIAWWAHIGGFVWGMLLALFFRPKRRQKPAA